MGTTGPTGRRLGVEHAPGRGVAIALALIVTFLWASSVVLLRLGLDEEVTDPIGFAGVRFTLAALMLFPLALPRMRSAGVMRMGRYALGGVVLYGLLMFGINQIAVHVSLQVVSASTMGLMIGLTPVVTALFMMGRGHERASLVQLVGIAILIVGVLIYFGFELPDPELLPMVLLAATVPLLVGGAAVLGRQLAVHVRHYGGPLGLTAIAMIAGGLFIIAVGLFVEGVPEFSLRAWLLIIWMAAVNTALAYTLWMQVQRTLWAVESSVLADVTVLMTALLGWLVLGEALDAFGIVGLILAVVGVAIVQLAPMYRARAIS